jgi:hypothetical protein
MRSILTVVAGFVLGSLVAAAFDSGPQYADLLSPTARWSAGASAACWLVYRVRQVRRGGRRQVAERRPGR